MGKLPPAKKSLGQNWLVDRKYVERIVDRVGPQERDLIVEIGPGPGALTGALVERAGQVAAIELDPRMIEPLRKRYPSVTVVEADALEVDLSGLVREMFEAHPGLERARVVANLPYYISSPMIARLVEHRGALSDATVMLQREVVDRLTARPGGKDYGALTVLVEMYAVATRLFDVPPGAFQPPPKVTSSLIRLEMRTAPAVDVPDERRFFGIVRAAFARRRKTLGNNLKATGLGALPEAAGIDPGRRAETLTLDEFAALARAGRDR